MGGGYRVPADGEFGEVVKRLRDMDRRIAELERPTGSQAAEALRQLNNATQTLSASPPTLDQSNTTTPFGATLVGPVTFNRPAWATRATVLATGTVYIAANPNAGFACQAAIQIDGTNGPFVPNFFAPRIAGVNSGGMYTGDDAIITDALRSSAFSRVFDTTAASFDVGWRLSVPDPWGAGDFIQANIVATVFWSAP